MCSRINKLYFTSSHLKFPTTYLKDYKFKLPRHISEDILFGRTGITLYLGLCCSLKLLDMYFNIFFSRCQLPFFP